ncbi:hypothetical protein [Embleya sp. NBC_00896]|uniref:hypothetical protein n=1 Tax=Embleya sp. NBC_00896 TaxID=2975961 RepID=UPI00386B9C9D|nr:hypothetical protein OG928_20915 [Embleya sp. NBC_00896]
MSRSKLATTGIACAAAAFAATMALSGTAHAVPDSRGVTLTCKDSTGTTWVTGGAGTLTSSDPGGANPQKMKLASPMVAPVAIPANSLATTIRTVQTGAGAGTIRDFVGTVNPPMNVGNPITLGAIPATARLAAGTTVRLQDTSAAAPSATNWSMKINTTISGSSVDIYCAGKQDPASGDFGF